MSFLKISDPVKRDLIVKEFLELKKNIWDDMISERTGEQQLQTDLSKIFKPITETQKAKAREITEELKPIKEGIENIPNIITLPAYPSIKTYKEPLEGEDTQYIGEVAEKYLRKFTTKEGADRMFGIKDEKGEFYIGDRKVKIKGNDIEVLDNVTGVVDKKYIGTHGLWELIVLPKPKNYTDEDFINYKKLLLKTNSMYRDNDPNNNNPKGNRQGPKWKKLIKPIWEDIKAEKKRKWSCCYSKRS